MQELLSSVCMYKPAASNVGSHRLRAVRTALGLHPWRRFRRPRSRLGFRVARRGGGSRLRISPSARCVVRRRHLLLRPNLNVRGHHPRAHPALQGARGHANAGRHALRQAAPANGVRPPPAGEVPGDACPSDVRTRQRGGAASPARPSSRTAIAWRRLPSKNGSSTSRTRGLSWWR